MGWFHCPWLPCNLLARLWSLRLPVKQCIGKGPWRPAQSFTPSAAAAAVASVVSDSVWPHRRQSTMLPCSWDSPGKNTGVGCHFVIQCMKVKMKVKSLCHVWLFTTPWTAAHQAPPFMGLSRQENWSGLPLPSHSLDLPNSSLAPFPSLFLEEKVHDKYVTSF